jgi:hypothetical protein
MPREEFDALSDDGKTYRVVYTSNLEKDAQFATRSSPDARMIRRYRTVGGETLTVTAAGEAQLKYATQDGRRITLKSERFQ